MADLLCVIKSVHIPTWLWQAKEVMRVTSYPPSMCPQTIPKSCVLSTDMTLLISHVNICLGLFSINCMRNVRHVFYSQCCRELRKTTRFTNHPPKTLQLCSLLASRGPLSAVLSYSSSKGDNLGVTVFKRHEKSENVVFKKRDLILSYAAEEGRCRTSVP